MMWTYADQTAYGKRANAIGLRVRELGRAVGNLDLEIEVGRDGLARPRTCTCVKISSTSGEEVVILTKEEFLNEYALFERGAVPKLQAALRRMRCRQEGSQRSSESGNHEFGA